MTKSKNRRWMRRHVNDPYVKQSQKEGYRSRASYKLLEIVAPAGLIKPGMTIVDLGAAPGGWSQVAANLAGHNGRVIALDLLPMENIAGVEFIQGDFSERSVCELVLARLNGTPVDLVISDMAPNLSGIMAVDQPRSMYLAELALDFAGQVLKPGGVFIAKLFQGEGFDAFVRDSRTRFNSVTVKKPDASRSASREVYMLAKGFKG